MDLGKQIRLKRIFSHPSGRLCSVAVDHFLNYHHEMPAGLRDLPRSGAPCKLSETHKQVLGAWAKKEACTAPQLKIRLSDEHGVEVSVWLVQSALKEKGYVWKRTRHSLRKKRDEEKFRKAPVEIAELVEKSKTGETKLAYVDEAGFALAQPNRNACR